MLFIDKRNKIAPNIYIIDIGGYFNNVFEGRFVSYRPYFFVSNLFFKKSAVICVKGSPIAFL
jgi:hypothetical protein